MCRSTYACYVHDRLFLGGGGGGLIFLIMQNAYPPFFFSVSVRTVLQMSHSTAASQRMVSIRANLLVGMICIGQIICRLK